LAIIGASGKVYFKPYRPTLLHVIWKSIMFNENSMFAT
jgi:hypothetical protein